MLHVSFLALVCPLFTSALQTFRSVLHYTSGSDSVTSSPGFGGLCREGSSEIVEAWRSRCEDVEAFLLVRGAARASLSMQTGDPRGPCGSLDR